MAIRMTGPTRMGGSTPAELWADTEADVASLPTQTKSTDRIGTVTTGSTCFVAGDGSGASLYGLRSDGTWVKLGGVRI